MSEHYADGQVLCLSSGGWRWLASLVCPVVTSTVPTQPVSCAAFDRAAAIET